MSTATLSTLAPTRPVSGGPGLLKLVQVELRKMLDTRAGLATALGVLGLVAVVVAVRAVTADAADLTLSALRASALEPAGILLPVVGVLLVASEWTQRTASTTFTLVPQRGRVLLAKLGAAVVLALIVLLAGFAIAALGTLVASPDVAGQWSLSLGLAGQWALFLVVSMLIGVGFGAALLASAPAIVLYFALPFGVMGLGTLSFFDEIANWIDKDRSLEGMLTSTLAAGDWAKVGTSLALWLVLPLAIGAYRILRREVRA